MLFLQIRSQADEIMLRHAESEGATVFEETKVTEVQFEGGNPNNRAISATWLSKKGQTGTISFGHIIDASGRNGIICTKYLKNRTYNEDLRNVAVWGYWKNGGHYLAGTPRDNSPLSEALTGTFNLSTPTSGFINFLTKTKPAGPGTFPSTTGVSPSAV